MPDWSNYHSNYAATCGIDDCKERFHTEREWAYHCQQKHHEFFKENNMAEKFQINNPKETTEAKL